MIPQIKIILYTTDLSDNSDDVFRYAINSGEKVLRRTRKPVFIIPLPQGEYVFTENIVRLSIK